MCAAPTATATGSASFRARLFNVFAILYGIALSITWHYDMAAILYHRPVFNP